MNKVRLDGVHQGVKTKYIIKRIGRIGMVTLLLAAFLPNMSCTTTYDAAGRPVQSVDPGMAVAGAAIAGLIGYSLANGDEGYDYDHHPRYCGRPRYYHHH